MVTKNRTTRNKGARQILTDLEILIVYLAGAVTGVLLYIYYIGGKRRK